MRYSQQEKMEIIRLVEESELGVKRTLKELNISKSTFYNWYARYKEEGYDGLAPRLPGKRVYWNRIPDKERQQVVELALEKPELSPRELACSITDNWNWFISESSVYRILKSRGLITTPTHIVIKAADEFVNKTTHPHQLWQTDFTYLMVIGWGWYYLQTIMDDYSRYIIEWELCEHMCAEDVTRGVGQALKKTGIKRANRPRLLSDNGSCYISNDLAQYLDDVGIKHIRGAPNHPQTQGKIERYHRSMKNVIKLDNYYSPDELRQVIGAFVNYYNNHRYHEALDNLTPADVYFGRGSEILRRRKETKHKTLQERRINYWNKKLKINV